MTNNNKIKCIEDVFPESTFDQIKAMIISNDGWEHRYCRKDLNIYTKKTVEDEQLECIKSTFSIKNISINTIFKIMDDDDYREEWDENFIDNYKVCKINSNCAVYYYSVKSPIIGVKKRDCLFMRIFELIEDKSFISVNRSIFHKKYTNDPDFVRAEIVNSSYLFERDIYDSNKVNVSFLSQINPNGSIPVWLVNYIAVKMAPNIVNSFKKSCKKYEKWESTQEKTYEERLLNLDKDVPMVDWNDLYKI